VFIAPMADNATRQTLLQLAAKRFDKISPAEQHLFEATANGENAKCTNLAEENRIIRGELFSWFCKDPEASAHVTKRGITIFGARIYGEVGLESAKIPFPLQAVACDFGNAICLKESQIVSLSLIATSIKYLEAERLAAEQIVDLNGVKAE
jgi:hypothetical protein